MRRGLAWATTALAVSALATAVFFRPAPLPAAPAPVRLEGSIVSGPPQQSLVVVPPPTIWLGGEADDSLDSADDSPDNDSLDSPDDSFDSPDD